MAFSLDFLGFGSKRKSAFRLLDREGGALDVDLRTVDDGIRQLLYQWAQQDAESTDHLDALLTDWAMFTGYLMRGPELSKRGLGSLTVTEFAARLENAVSNQDQESIDVRLIKLILATGRADRDIAAVIGLEDDPTGGD